MYFCVHELLYKNLMKTESYPLMFALSISFRRKPKSIAERILNGMILFPFHHPIRLVSNLIQFGYEPVRPYRRYNIILQQFFWYHPGLFGYAQHIVRERGWLALYRVLCHR